MLSGYGIKILACCFLILVCEQINAQAWVRDKGSAYYQISYSTMAADKMYWRKEPAVDLDYKVVDASVSAYAEIGLGKLWMLTGLLPFRFPENVFVKDVSASRVSSGRLVGIGNVEFAALKGIKNDGPLVVSSKIGLGLPTARYDPITGLRTGIDASSGIFGLNIGYSKAVFASIQTDFRIRTNGYSESVHQRVEIGKKVSKKIFLIAGHEMLIPFRNGDFDDGNTVYTGVAANNTEFYSYNLKFGYELLSNWKIWMYTSGGYYGQYVLRAPAFSISVAYEK